jgi:formate dehydrogenase maturation protein FdhE
MTITSKFNGKCKACGGFIPAGSQVNWSRNAGARHLNCGVPVNAPVAVAAPVATPVARVPGTLVSKYNGTCKACGGFLAAGSTIRWTRADGARHLTDADCAAVIAAKPVAA